jgi:alpha,alpha-trehalase
MAMKLSLQIHELGELFERVQLESVFPDGKTFPDCIPKRKLEAIKVDFEKKKTSPGFNLKDFVHANFVLPHTPAVTFQSDSSRDSAEHIDHLWNFLTRKPTQETSSIISLPKPYVVPGGRFREIYYWDSYFTMLGLLESGRADLATSMVENFAFLIDTIGYIPNGNRTYFVGRSQPPFFSCMVALVGKERPGFLLKHLNHLEKEYAFWMQGAENLKTGQADHRVVKLSDGSLLNRYWDENDTPRPESYKEDVELSQRSSQKPSDLFRNLRAAAESGWDFSSRWFKEGDGFTSTHTTEILPIELNCLLVHLEEILGEAYRQSDQTAKAKEHLALAMKRKQAIQKYCWDSKQRFYFDYDFKSQKIKSPFTLAGFFPMFFKVATPDQAVHLAEHLQSKFLKKGGLTTTLVNSGQQWDAPNGWAPLQWICCQGLVNYGFDALASEVRKRWLDTTEAVFQNTGKMTEKYDVWNENSEASGGEYPNQDGFGWTNGVYLAMKNKK